MASLNVFKFESPANITYSSFKCTMRFQRAANITCVRDKEVFLLHRCGNLWWVTMWMWRWRLRETTGKRILTLRYVAASCPVTWYLLSTLRPHVCTTTAFILNSSPAVEGIQRESWIWYGYKIMRMLFCVRTISQSRNRDGDQKPSKDQDAKSTSGNIQHDGPEDFKRNITLYSLYTDSMNDSLSDSLMNW